MSLLFLVIFAVINSIFLQSIEPDTPKGNYTGAIMLGVMGAIMGGMIAYSLFGGSLAELSLSLSFISCAEILLLALRYGKKLGLHTLIKR